MSAVKRKMKLEVGSGTPQPKTTAAAVLCEEEVVEGHFGLDDAGMGVFEDSKLARVLRPIFVSKFDRLPVLYGHLFYVPGRDADLRVKGTILDRDMPGLAR